MKFQISHILNNRQATIKLLSYELCDLDDLDLKILSADELTRFSNFKSDKRKLEFYFTRFLWSRFSEFEEITYEGTGKPHLRNGFISISHSQKMIAIAYSPINHVGVDIEHFNPKIFLIANKFLTEDEKNRFDINDQNTITTLWSIKEAMYKVLNIPGLIFRENLHILEIGETNLVHVRYKGAEKTFPFKRLIFDKFILTYCAKDILV